MAEDRARLDVAVGVLIRPDQSFLLASRPAGKPYAGYWEFPGGKLERGESIASALARELREELGIEIGPVAPWVVREFDYPHASVRLHFCRVFTWSGVLHAHEGQDFGFHTIGDLPAPLLPATVPVLRWLGLPPIFAISDAARLGSSAFLRKLEARLAGGVSLVSWREPDLPESTSECLFVQALARVRAAGARLLVSSRHPRAWSERADGVHLTAADLARATQRPSGLWAAASVHTREELARAAELDLDFAVAGTVLPTPTHPDAQLLGWEGFAAVVAGSAIPVYAIGGLAAEDLGSALQAGAHGLALRRAAWSD
jgi:8-oxo-dGTP diphosphatase